MTQASGKADSKTHGNSGGAAAMRGFYVQTLSALFAAVDATPPFTAITLEPVGAQDQFDFSWCDGAQRYAVQVKSTIGEFSKTQASKVATKLKAAASNGEHCTLILVGDCDASMNKVRTLAGVTIEKRRLDIADQTDAIAQRLAKFMEANQLHPGTASEREAMVDSLMGQFFKQAISRQELSRAAFIAMLARLIRENPRHSPSPPIDIDRITRYAPPELIGRSAETALLESAWQQAMGGAKSGAKSGAEPDAKSGAESGAEPGTTSGATSGTNPRPHILSFVALGGEGKTALVADWAKQLQLRHWPGCDAVFGWSFYSQGTDQQAAASSELFINEALCFFGEAELAASSQSGVDKARRLAQVVGARRVLLILDGLEPLQYAPTSVMRGALKDQALAQLLRGLAGANLGLCVLTTRYSIPDLHAFWLSSAPEHKLLRLPTAAGVALLRKLGVQGAQAECEKLVDAVQGHALSVQLFGAYLRDAHFGDIRQRDRVRLMQADEAEQGGHAFRVMDAYVAWLAGDGVAGKRALAVLKLLGLFDRPASAEWLTALLQAPAIEGLTDDLLGLDEAARNIIYSRLQEAGLLTIQRDSGHALQALDAHPLLREYFAQETARQQHAAWQAAHRRLYGYLCEHTKDKPQPTLEDLQPLYQAVAHGCLAGMQQQACEEVYDARIGRRGEAYAVSKLGAFGTDLGAVACFFEPAWQRVSPALREGDQAWLLHQAAFNLRALGRLSEATEPMRASLVMDVIQERWKEAAISASNLSELALTLGDLVVAVQYAEQAVTHADSSADAFLPLITRTTHAEALHQAGQPGAASTLFCAAELMQAERQPTYPLLYSLQGFQYCDLLLAAPETAAWECSVQGAADGGKLATMADSSATAQRSMPAVAVPTRHSNVAGTMQTCNEVTQRAAQTLDWAEQNNAALLDIALNHLTLGRAALFAAILAGQPIAPCQSELQHAVDGLRRAGRSDHLPRGLLTRAWLRTHTGHHTGPDSAQTDLDEAWDIAVQGPMPLFLADIHLYRAGLFHHLQRYPWQSPSADAQQARRLIAKHGYLRRMGALEMLEQVLGGKVK